jgi:N-acyl-D-amino-acid deacylase
MSVCVKSSSRAHSVLTSYTRVVLRGAYCVSAPDVFRLLSLRLLAQAAGQVCLLIVLWAVPIVAAADDSQLTGASVPQLKALDELLIKLAGKYQIPGMTLTVTNQGGLVSARGCGYADVELQQHVQPTTLFRIASISKPITAVAILQLVEAGKLKLEDSILDRLPAELLKLTPEQRRVHPWGSITVLNCLHHNGGWDREASFDPMFRSVEIAQASGIPAPAGTAEIIRHMQHQPLDFKPGARFAYSNFGYCLLGRIIEAATGKPYGEAVQENIWRKIGATEARLGRTLLKNRAANEVAQECSGTRSRVLRTRLGGQRFKYSGQSEQLAQWRPGWHCHGACATVRRD